MKIERVSISNFRCFGPAAAVIDFEHDLTAFVGNNGSGKTALFAAIGKLFGVTNAQRALKKSDFHVPLSSNGIQSGAELSIDCVLGFPDLEEGVEDDAIPDVFSHMAAAGEDEPLKIRIRLQATWVDDGTPDGTIDDSIKWVTTLDEDFDWDECPRLQAVERNYIQLVYVPAARNAFDQVTEILKGRLWRAARWSSTLAAAAESGSQDIQSLFDAEAPAQFITERLTRRWNQVQQGDTDTVPLLRLVEPSLDELVRRAEFVFFPDEAVQVRRLADLSDGQRSLFHIALTAATLEIEQDALVEDPQESTFDQEKLRRTYLTLIAIEEPENSLSPFFLSRIMSQAREIGGMSSAQVLVSSHSASILARVEPQEVRYARLDIASRESTIRALTLPADGSEASRYIRLAIKAYPELYFARFVILAEGESEAVVLPRLASAMDFPLDRSFVPIVPLGGRFAVHFWRLLNDLGIPHATLLDLDAGRRHGGAMAIARVLNDLATVGRTVATNKYVLDGTIDLDEVEDIDDQELIDQDQSHPWLKALRREGIYFSSPIDLDFAMLLRFGEVYQVPRPAGQGPRMSATAISEKKATTLKTGGRPGLYDDDYDDAFAWYPYLFLGQSKPETHLGALARLEDTELAADAPQELIRLIRRAKSKVLR